MYQENEKNDRNFDIVELEFCSFPKDFADIPRRMNRKLQITPT